MTGKRARNDLWRRVAAHVEAHGDPRPKVNPLAEPKNGTRVTGAEP
jgi:hypothetical protein